MGSFDEFYGYAAGGFCPARLDNLPPPEGSFVLFAASIQTFRD
jgi:hypothetical protein